MSSKKCGNPALNNGCELHRGKESIPGWGEGASEGGGGGGRMAFGGWRVHQSGSPAPSQLPTFSTYVFTTTHLP